MRPPPPTALFQAQNDGQASVDGLAGQDQARVADEASSSPRPGSEECVAGDLIGDKYRLERVIGTGGMGKVWLARNLALDADVAIKLIRSEAALPEVADRLLVEARAAARLGHPAIVRVFDFGRTSCGDPFLAMEMLEGESLAAALAGRGKVNERRAVQTILPIAHALAAAHAEGIVHRDIKPANLFLARMQDGLIQPKLLDFGIAKLQRSGVDKLTQAGTMVGTPEYMSPEQARGDDFDHRVDVWALSVVLYEMVTGRMPFAGKNYNALLRAVTDSEPVPTVAHGVGDEALWAILSRGMSKDVDARWSSMRELGTALAGWLTAHEVYEDIAGSSLRTAWLDRKLVDTNRHVFSTCPPPLEYDAVRAQAATRPTIDVPVPRAQLELAPTTAVAMVTSGIVRPAGPDSTPPFQQPTRRRRVVAIGMGMTVVVGALGMALVTLSPRGPAIASRHLSSGLAANSIRLPSSSQPSMPESVPTLDEAGLEARSDRAGDGGPTATSHPEASAVKPVPALARPSQRKLKRPF